MPPMCNLNGGQQWWICLFFSIIVYMLPCFHSLFILNEDATRQYIDGRKLGVQFKGKPSGQESFKLLKASWPYMIVGSRNTLYNISYEDLSKSKVLNWVPTKADLEECRMKGKTVDDCQNYIRLFASNTDGTSIVCGTNAFKPLCRVYDWRNKNATVVKEFSAVGMLPYDVRQNSSFVYMPQTQEMFSATTADFGSSDPLIYKTDLTKTDSMGIRTDRYNKELLNEPNFVSSFLSNDFVYFWFREVAYEPSNNGKAMYARVARICRNDRGTKHRESWTSFIKARLNCSVPREFPYYFDELVATSEDMASNLSPTGSRVIYAVFNSPNNIVPSSAICAYRMDDVERIFDYSDFKTNPSDSLRLARHGFAGSTKKKPRSCVNDTHALSEEAVSYLIRNPLVKEAVPSVPNSPLLVMLGHSGKFTQIAVHPNVIAADGREYDVMFVGTDNGKLVKVISKTGDNDSVLSIIVEKVTVFSENNAITGLHIEQPHHMAGGELNKRHVPRLLVISNSEIRLMPLFHCSLSQNCNACVNLQDPYCAWDRKRNACIGKVSWSDHEYSNNRMVRTIVTTANECPQKDGTVDNALKANQNRLQDGQIKLAISKVAERAKENESTTVVQSAGKAFENIKYEAEAVKVADRGESFAIAVPLTFIFSTLFGFLVGYGCRLNRRTKKNAPIGKTVLYGTDMPNCNGLKTANQKIPVVNNYAFSTGPFSIYGTLPRESQTVNCAARLTTVEPPFRPLTNCNTLPARPQLVKKIYV